MKKLGDELRLLRVMTGLNWGDDGNKRENGCVCMCVSECVCVCVGVLGFRVREKFRDDSHASSGWWWQSFRMRGALMQRMTQFSICKDKAIYFTFVHMSFLGTFLYYRGWKTKNYIP